MRCTSRRLSEGLQHHTFAGWRQLGEMENRKPPRRRPGADPALASGEGPDPGPS